MKRLLIAALVLFGAIGVCAPASPAGRQNPPGGYGPGGSGGGSGGSATFGNGTSVIDGSATVTPGFMAFDCTLTSGSNQISCTNTTITQTMVGWLIHATNAAGGVNAYANSVYEIPLNSGAENTITGCVPSCPSKTFTVTKNASATVNPGQSWVSIGPDMTTAMFNLFQNAWNNPTVFPNCPTIYLPGPIIMVKHGLVGFHGGVQGGFSCSMPLEANSENSGAVIGSTPFTSQIMLTQDFDFTATSGQSCDSGNCFFQGFKALRLQNVGFTAGGGNYSIGANVYIIAANTDTSLTNFSCIGLGGNTNSMFGVLATGDNQPFVKVQLDGCATIGLVYQGADAPIITNSFVGDNTQDCVRLIPNSTPMWVMSSNNGYGNCGTGKNVISLYNLGGAPSFYSVNDTISSGTGCGFNVGATAGAITVRITNDLIAMTGTGNGICGNNAGQIFVSNTNLVPQSGTAAQVVLSNTSKFVSGGANSISGITLNATTVTLIGTPTDTISGTLTNFTPTITVTGFGATPTVTLGAGINTVERGSVNVAAGGAGPAATGTLKVAFNQTYSLSGNPPACGFIFGNGTGTLTAPVTVIRDTTANVTTTQYQILWTAGGAVVAGNNYNIDWQCEAR